MLGGEVGSGNEFTPCFSSPLSLASFGESVFVCDTNKRALRLVSCLQSYKQLGRNRNAFIKLFQLDEDMPYSVESASLQDGIVVLEDVKTVMKDIERNAYYRTGKRCPQGPDLAYEANERFIRNAVQVLQEH